MQSRTWSISSKMDKLLSHYGFWIASAIIGLCEALYITGIGYEYSIHRSTCGIFAADLSILIPQYATKCLLFLVTVAVGGMITVFCSLWCGVSLFAVAHDFVHYLRSPKKPKIPKYKVPKFKTPFGDAVSIKLMSVPAMPNLVFDKRFFKRASLSMLLVHEEFWYVMVAIFLYVPAILADAWVIHNAQMCLTKANQIGSVAFASTLAILLIIVVPVQWIISHFSLVNKITVKCGDLIRDMESEEPKYCTRFTLSGLRGRYLDMPGHILENVKSSYNVKVIVSGRVEIADTDTMRLDFYAGSVDNSANVIDIYFRHSDKFDCFTACTQFYGWNVLTGDVKEPYMSSSLNLGCYSLMDDIQAAFEKFVEDVIADVCDKTGMKDATAKRNALVEAEIAKRIAEDAAAAEARAAEEKEACELADELDLGPDESITETGLTKAHENLIKSLNDAETIATDTRCVIEENGEGIDFSDYSADTVIALRDCAAKALDAAEKIDVQAIVSSATALKSLADKLALSLKTEG